MVSVLMAKLPARLRCGPGARCQPASMAMLATVELRDQPERDDERTVGTASLPVGQRGARAADWRWRCVMPKPLQSTLSTLFALHRRGTDGAFGLLGDPEPWMARVSRATSPRRRSRRDCCVAAPAWTLSSVAACGG